MSLFDALALTGGLLWALGWGAVGCLFAWWVAVGGFFLGGFVGLVLAFMGLDLILARPPASTRLGVFVEVLGSLLGPAAFLVSPVVAFVLVRAA